MMKILGIDSSVPQGSVALLENDQIIAETSLSPEAGTPSDTILKIVDDVLSRTPYKLGDVDGFSVTAGPGSFTGLRVGMSLVKGFALALEKPVQGIDTLMAVAASTEQTEHPVCAILDARKQEVYCAFFRYEGNKLIRTTPDSVMPPEELCKAVSEPTVFIGSGLETYREFFSGRLRTLFIDNSKAIKHSVAASAALLARPHLEDHTCFDLGELKIKYVRKSEAEMNYMKQTL